MAKWRFIPDYAGYRAVMRSTKVQSILDSKAESVKTTADGMLPDDGYTLDGHVVVDFKTKTTVPGRVIRTKTDTARYAQANDKTLTKALKAGF